jgi:hypothetical protein
MASSKSVFRGERLGSRGTNYEIRRGCVFSKYIKYSSYKNITVSWAHISGRQTPGLNPVFPPPFYITNAGGELRVKPGV